MRSTKTKVLSLLLTLTLLLGLSPGTVWAAETEAISTPEQFSAMEPDGSYVLMEDIEISVPYGSSSQKFTGTFDGNGHTVTLNTLDENSTANYVGVFSMVGSGATIKNLTVAGKINGNNYVGGIAGQSEGRIVDCGNLSNVSGRQRIGGIVGDVLGGAIENCYNTGDIARSSSTTSTNYKWIGGIAGYIKGTAINNCYNAGIITANMQCGGIIGFLTGDETAVKNCYWKENCVILKVESKDQGFGFGSGENCHSYTEVSSLLEELNKNTGEHAPWKLNNDNYPVLDITSSGEIDTTPRLTVSQGSVTLYKEGNKPATLTAVRENIPDDVAINWETDNETAVILEAADGDNNSIIIKPNKGGTAIVTAMADVNGETLTASSTVTVMPHITTVEIDGTAAVGETVKAKVNILGGKEYDYENFPSLTFQWRYLTNEDYSSGNTTNYRDISGATSREFIIPEELAGQYLSFRIWYNGQEMIPSSPTLIAAKAEPEPEPPTPVEPEKPVQTPQEAASALGSYYKLAPVWGKDTNLAAMVRSDLARKGFEGMAVTLQSVEEVYGGGGIASDGGVTYFYADPNTAPSIRFASYRVSFALSKGGETAILKDVPVTLYWDVDRVKGVIREEILSKIQVEAEAAENLSLPKAVDGKKWALIEWTSSDSEALAISTENQTAADTLFAPYVGVVRRGDRARTVTLTAAVHFQLTNDMTGSEPPIVLYQTYTVTIPPIGKDEAATIQAGLMAKLDAGFAAKGLTDEVTGARLTANEEGVYTAYNDIRLPTTRDFGVDGKYYPVAITSSSESIKAPDVNNAARVEVLRPAPGEKDAAAAVTVTLHDRDTSITASKTFQVLVPALIQEEIDRELVLMERVKNAYFEGIRGQNTGEDAIFTDLSPFQEVYEEDGRLVWVRTAKDRVGRGIVPTPIEGWEEMEAWRLFRSSNPAVISHEDLRVTRQPSPKAVTITSYLSSETLGRYGQLYQSEPAAYARYAPLEELYYQPVTAAVSFSATAASSGVRLLVRGTNDPSSTVPVTETVDVTFTLRGLDETWIDTVQLTGLDETSSAYDVLSKVLSERGYTFYRKQGTYVYSIQRPDGTSLTEKELGENAGWLYTVNGRLPDVYMGACGLHSGDRIVVYYTRDASKDDPNWSWPGSGGSSTPANPATPATPATPSVTPSDPPKGSAQVTEDRTGGSYTVTLPQQSAGPQKVTIPAAGDSQVVVILQADGSEKVIKKSIVSNGMAQFLLEKGASVRLADWTGGFSDVAPEAWYASAVDFVSSRGIFSGVGGGRFAPGQSLSRGMLATALFALEEPSVQPGPGQFEDVADRAWYARSVAWAAGQGIVSGYGNGRFGPDDPITREQLALMLYRYANSLGVPTGGRDSLTGFADWDQVSPWAAEAVAWAVDSGIISGRGNGVLAPSSTATRAEAAVMIRQLVALMVKA